MINDPIAYFIKPGTHKRKGYEKYYSHVAYEL